MEVGFSLNDRHGKYICIHCKMNFTKIPKYKKNECHTAYSHFIVKKSRLKLIERKR
jgi:DNA-directed RNA polymerase subunit RPC12/RpoP